MTRRLVGLFVFLPLASLAQSPEALQSFEQGREAFEQQDFARALVAFEAAVAARMEGPAVHYNIGVAAYRIGQYDKARAAFEQAALTPSMTALAQYNLGLVALAQGDELRAIEAFERAYAGTSDMRLRDLALARLEALGDSPDRSGIVWGGYASSGLGYDDNVTLIAGNQALGISREEDVYWESYFAGSAQISSAWRVDADASLLKFGDLDEFDQWGIGGAARYRFAFDAWSVDIGGQLSTTYLDGERFDVRETAYAQARRSLANDAMLRGRYRLSHVDGSDAYPGFSGLVHELTARLVHRWLSWTLGVGYVFEVNDYDAASLSAIRHQVSGDVRIPLSRFWQARASLAYRHSEYDDTSLGAEQRLELGTGAELMLSDRWTLAIQYSFSDNDADIREFAYRRNRVYVGVAATF